MNDLIEYRPFVTEKAYLIGEKNGISRDVVYQRWALYMWDIEKAITEPVKIYVSEWPIWKETAKKNGVSGPLYHARVKKGMTPERAATKPVEKRR